jgi:protease I
MPTPQRAIWVAGSELAHVRVAFVVANDGIEQAELVQPWHSMVDAGARAELVAIDAGLAQTVRHLTRVTRFPVDRTTEEAQVGDFDGIVLPGGVINADRLRGDAPAVDFLVAIVESGKPVGALCHGLCPLIDGDLVCGRTVTSAPGMRTDLRTAGAYWVDREVARCSEGQNTLVTSPRPADLNASCRELTTTLAPTGTGF